MYRRDKIELNELDPNNWNNILTKKNDTIHRLDKGVFFQKILKCWSDPQHHHLLLTFSGLFWKSEGSIL